MTRESDAEREAREASERERNEQATTYPPTPGDRNEEEREKREFGRPAGGQEDTDAEGAVKRDPEGTKHLRRENTPDA